MRIPIFLHIAILKLTYRDKCLIIRSITPSFPDVIRLNIVSILINSGIRVTTSKKSRLKPKKQTNNRTKSVRTGVNVKNEHMQYNRPHRIIETSDKKINSFK